MIGDKVKFGSIRGTCVLYYDEYDTKLPPPGVITSHSWYISSDEEINW